VQSVIIVRMKTKEHLSGLALRAMVASLDGWSVASHKSGHFVVTDGKIARHGVWNGKNHPPMSAPQIASYFPHYEADLNVMHEVEQRLDAKHRDRYYKVLTSMLSQSSHKSGKMADVISAKAQDRALAFVETMTGHHSDRGTHVRHS
jgi:hypothetical protein